MYFYKKIENKFTLIDYIESNNQYDVEERLISIMRNDRDTISKHSLDINTSFNGHYTIYDFGGSFKYISSVYVLDNLGKIRTDVGTEPVPIPPKRRRNRKKKNQITSETNNNDKNKETNN